MPDEPNIAIQPIAGNFGDLFRRINAGGLVPLGGDSPGAAPAGWTLLVGARSLNAALLTIIARLGETAVHGESSPRAGQAQPGAASTRRGSLPPWPAVCVLDAGNRFNAYTVARAARGRPGVLNRITVSRAFTCYQVLSLLETSSSAPAGDAAAAPRGRTGSDGMLLPRPVRPAGPVTFVVLDLLSTFYDESVQAGERKRLLRDCIRHLERLVGAAGGSSTTKGVETTTSAGYSPNGNRELPRLVASVHPPKVPSQTAVELLELLQASAADTYFIQPDAPAAEPLRLF
jgi:hypothetical protein